MKELSTKASILQHIFAAKSAHKEWVRKAEKLVNGLDGFRGEKVAINVDKSFIALDSSSCEFGQWFNAHKNYLTQFPSIGRFVNRIEEHHEQLHQTYADIYHIFFVAPQKRSMMHKIFTLNKKNVSEQERIKASIHLTYLKRSSKELLAVLSVLEEKIKEMQQYELNDLIKAS